MGSGGAGGGRDGRAEVSGRVSGRIGTWHIQIGSVGGFTVA